MPKPDTYSFRDSPSYALAWTLVSEYLPSMSVHPADYVDVQESSCMQEAQNRR